MKIQCRTFKASNGKKGSKCLEVISCAPSKSIFIYEHFEKYPAFPGHSVSEFTIKDISTREIFYTEEAALKFGYI